MPEPEKINEILTQIQRNRGERLFINDLQPILLKLNKPQYFANFENGKSASQLAIEVLIILIIKKLFSLVIETKWLSN